MNSNNQRRGLYPPIAPTASGHLPVTAPHEIYFEECGNSTGKPVVFVHGGPGAATSAATRRFFDPRRYRIVLFDQRGAGKSRPHACLEHNTTADLVSDLEALRDHLDIERWQVFGGSWGSTLALIYSQAHPERVTELVLRGIFLMRSKELRWFYQDGASRIYPDHWEKFLAPIPDDERADLLQAYHRRLMGGDRQQQLEAARAWSLWEGVTSNVVMSDAGVERFREDKYALALARIETHYFVNHGFMDDPDQIFRDLDHIRTTPAVIVQGRYDLVCPMTTAWELHRAWPEAEFRIVPDAGHSAFESGTVHELVSATDRFAE